jgi:predicted AAA+ superfamily ATPase
LANLLPERVGSPLSINALKEDIGTAFETIRDWVILLENLYYCFRLYPYTGRLGRTLRKEAKLYLYDWNEVEDEGSRFENMIAVHLMKAVEMWNAMGEKACTLFYIRDKEKREVDFVVMEGKVPQFLVEVKMSDLSLSPSLLYYQDKLKMPIAFQVVQTPNTLRKSRERNRLQWICSADSFLASLP